ncbi:hypothetical protein CSV80_16790 [Sporosarcina sp. P12(2017)]|nr:hypothetical protein CSV81_16650 [Sporosarcina sp. P10]PIC59312.1 hypothetical protein CSV80_16790 [Sporosarcina sp. P12(2017)]
MANIAIIITCKTCQLLEKAVNVMREWETPLRMGRSELTPCNRKRNRRKTEFITGGNRVAEGWVGEEK